MDRFVIIIWSLLMSRIIKSGRLNESVALFWQVLYFICFLDFVKYIRWLFLSNKKLIIASWKWEWHWKISGLFYRVSKLLDWSEVLLYQNPVPEKADRNEMLLFWHSKHLYRHFTMKDTWSINALKYCIISYQKNKINTTVNTSSHPQEWL